MGLDPFCAAKGIGHEGGGAVRGRLLHEGEERLGLSGSRAIGTPGCLARVITNAQGHNRRDWSSIQKMRGSEVRLERGK